MSIEKIKELRELTGAGMLDIKKALGETKGNVQEAIKWLRENGIAKAAKKAGRIAADGLIFIAHTNKKAVLIELNSETDFVASNEEFIKLGNNVANSILDSNIKTLEDSLKLKINNESIEMVITNLTGKIGEKINLRRIAILDKNPVIYLHSNKKIGVAVEAEEMDNLLIKDIAMHIAAMKPIYLSMDNISDDVLKEEKIIARKELAAKIVGKPENVVEAMIKGKVQKVLSDLVLLEQPFVKNNTKKIKDLQGNGKILNFVRFEVGEGIEKKQNNFVSEVVDQLKQKQ